MSTGEPGEPGPIHCNACQVDISNKDKNTHYSSEWHRYNVKRKCAGLSVVPQNLFESKLAALQKAVSSPEAEFHQKCKACNKLFHSQASFDQHLQTNKHKKNLASLPPGSDFVQVVSPAVPPPVPDQNEMNEKEREEMGDAENEKREEGEEEEQGEPIPVTHCLFCSHASDSLQANLDHMTQVHSFFIPYIEYLEDLEGLIEYLGYKVGMGRVCLYCNGRGRAFYSDVQALRNHMADKGHCKIRFEDEDEEEFEPFYDFNKTLDNPAQSTALIVSTERSVQSVSALGEWLMSDGTVIGHRSLLRYYKQKPRSTDQRESVLINMLANQYRLLALPGYSEQERKSHYSQHDHRVLRMQNRRDLHVGMQANTQKYYVCQNPM